MNDVPKKDREIIGRTAALTTLLGYFVGPRYGWPEEVTAAAGFFLGGALDHVMYTLKTWMQKWGKHWIQH